MKRFLKSNKGITGADAVLGVALAILFSGIIATLSYNIYVTSSSLKRSSKALEYITSTFEYVATQYYDNVTEDNIKEYINNLDEKIKNIKIVFADGKEETRSTCDACRYDFLNKEINNIKAIKHGKKTLKEF